MSEPQSTAAARRRTRSHYDRYPFGFDQEEILAEKLERRMMGTAIQETGPSDLVFDVGCGASRVARLVQRTTGARTVGVDLSLNSLRQSLLNRPGPLVNADNLRLPFRTGSADLVISNGVIHHTPDARASFMELARITKPGGRMIVSVYNRRAWYYYLWIFPGGLIRWLRRIIGDRGLRFTVFPFFHLGLLILLPLATRRPLFVPVDASWNLFHDSFTTPQCTFHTFEEVAGWAEDAGMICEDQQKEAANQLVTSRLRKPETA